LKAEELKHVGNAEWCTYGKLGIQAIKARIDSGAKTSSIQSSNIEIFQKNDEDWVRFTVFPIQKDENIQVICSSKIIDKRPIKSSFGASEERLIIRTPVTIGEETFDIELSLANRNNMEYKMLLGREALSGRYLVNVSEKHIQKQYTKKAITKFYT